MATIELGGRTIEINLGAVNVREYRAMFDPKQPQADEDATMAKICGLTVAELTELSVLDYKRLYQEVFRVAREPLPN